MKPTRDNIKNARDIGHRIEIYGGIPYTDLVAELFYCEFGEFYEDPEELCDHEVEEYAGQIIELLRESVKEFKRKGIKL